VTQLVSAVLSTPGWAMYLIVGLLAFGESAAFVGLVLPGETALLLGGVAAATGRVSLPAVIAVAILAAVTGDSVGYEIGRLGGTAIRNSRAGRFVGDQRWDRAQTFVGRRGGWAVLVGRWIGLMRALAPALAGMTRMPYRRFLLFNAAGGALWATAVVLGGYLAGASWQRVSSVAGQLSLALNVLGAGVVLVSVLVRWRARLLGLLASVLASVRAWATRLYRPRRVSRFGIGFSLCFAVAGLLFAFAAVVMVRLADTLAS